MFTSLYWLESGQSHSCQTGSKHSTVAKQTLKQKKQYKERERDRGKEEREKAWQIKNTMKKKEGKYNPGRKDQFPLSASCYRRI